MFFGIYEISGSSSIEKSGGNRKIRSYFDSNNAIRYY